MDTLQLRLFVSIASTLNFSRTAKQFFITQPAVSRHIKILESSLGVKLLSRTSRKIQLTEEGAEFLQYANLALEVISDAENRLHNMAQGRTGHIRIAALSSTAHQLSSCLVRLSREYPAVQVDVDLLEGSELISAIQKGEYNFYFAIADMVDGVDAHEYQMFSQDRLELFANTGIAEDIDINDWSTVQRHPFVSIQRSDAWLTHKIRLICKNRGITPSIINYYNRAEAAVLAVDAGIGIALLPGKLKHLYHHPNVVTVCIPGDDTEVSYVCVWKSGEKNWVSKPFRDIIFNTLPQEG